MTRHPRSALLAPLLGAAVVALAACGDPIGSQSAPTISTRPASALHRGAEGGSGKGTPTPVEDVVGHIRAQGGKLSTRETS
jgi:hypothetical protein